MKKPTQNCGTCRYSKPIEGNDSAVSCQRFPPQVMKVDGPSVSSNFPLLAKVVWCGEWEKRGI